MTSGIAFHSHHDELVEYVWDYEWRAAYIRTRKPKAERPLRLKLFRLISPELLPSELVRTCAEAEKVSGKVDKVWNETSLIWAKINKAIQANYPALEELHTRLCPNCPWDGKTIFSEKVK